MRICLVSRRVDETGGIGRYVFELGKYLLGRKHEVHVFTNRYDAPIFSGLQIHHVPMINAFFLERIKCFALAKMFQLWTFAFISRLMIRKNRYDLVHVQGDSLVAADVRTAHSCHKAWLLFAKQRKAGIVQSFLKSVINPLHFMVWWIEKQNYTKCKRVITVSRRIADEIQTQYHTPLEMMTPIYNGVDLDKYSPVCRNEYGQGMRKEQGIADDETVLLFVGHEFERKGLDIILKVMQELRDDKLSLLVVGGDKDEKYKRLADTMGLASKIRFIGRTSKVEKYFAVADIFILPAVYEPFGLVIAEAMASGLPVIVSRNAGAAELIQDGLNGILLDPHNIKSDLLKYLPELLHNPDLRSSIAKQAREMIRKHSWEKMGELTEQVYRDVING